MFTTLLALISNWCELSFIYAFPFTHTSMQMFSTFACWLYLLVAHSLKVYCGLQNPVIWLESNNSHSWMKGYVVLFQSLSGYLYCDWKISVYCSIKFKEGYAVRYSCSRAPVRLNCERNGGLARRDCCFRVSNKDAKCRWQCSKTSLVAALVLILLGNC
jgi:hypothetical protein